MRSLNIKSMIPTTEDNKKEESPISSVVDKKKVVFIGGVHGDEHVGRLLVYKLYDTLVVNKHYLNDYFEFTFYPVANPSGALHNKREFVQETSHDLNRLNQYNESILRNRIEQLVHENDIIFDIHNSPDVINCFLFSMNRNHDHEIKLCEKANVDILLRYSQSFTIRDYAKVKFQNKLSFTYEFSGMNSFHYTDNLYIAINDVIQVLKTHINEFDSIKQDQTEIDYDKYLIHNLYSPVQGTVEFITNKIYFNKDEIVAYIHYIDNQKIHCIPIKAPVDLKVVAKGNMYVPVNGVILLYQKIK